MLVPDGGGTDSPVRWGISFLNLLVGGLFITRRPAIANGGVSDVLLALPALVVAGLALKLAPVPADWSGVSQSVFLLGAALSCWSLLRLGRSFSVLPARRDLVTLGPYRWVRHPVYLLSLIHI